MMDQGSLSRAWAALTTHTPLHTLVYAVVGVWLCRFVYGTFLYARFFSPLRKMPGPSYGHWLLGRMPEVVTGEAGSAVEGWTEKYGRTIRFMGMFGTERVCFMDEPALKQILVDQPYLYPKPNWAKDILGVTAGYGLLTLEGQEHAALRRFMNPAFAFKYLEMQFPLYLGPVNGLVDIVKDKLKEADDPDGTILELTHNVNACLLDIICSTAFGYDTDHLHNPHEPLGESYETLVNMQNGKNMAFFIAILGLPLGPTVMQWAVKQSWTGKGVLALVRKLGLGKSFSNLGDFLFHMYRVNEISRKMLATKLDEAKKLREAGQTDLDSGKVDILSLLARASLDESSPYRMDQKLLEAQVLTFLGAGHETTASGMAWAMWELANHQDVQAKLRAECQEILSVSAEPTYAQIKDAPYLHAFCMEVMRLRPPTPQTARITTVDSTVSGWFVPRGTEIYVGTLLKNTDKTVWGEDAKEFRPERWFNLPAESKNGSIWTFIVGAHSCPGRNMAIHELKLLTAAIVAHFELSKISDDQTVKAVAAITNKPEYPMPLRLKLANWTS